jgi:hypothetical protein
LDTTVSLIAVPGWDLFLVLDTLLRDPYEPWDKASLGELHSADCFPNGHYIQQVSQYSCSGLSEYWLLLSKPIAILRLNFVFSSKTASFWNNIYMIVLKVLFPSPKSAQLSELQSLDVMKSLNF